MQKIERVVFVAKLQFDVHRLGVRSCALFQLRGTIYCSYFCNNWPRALLLGGTLIHSINTVISYQTYFHGQTKITNNGRKRMGKGKHYMNAQL